MTTEIPTIKVPKYKHLTEEQSIVYDKNTYVLIGENGCGKSTILESIFKKYIEDEKNNIICFTSGQNELFSNIFNKHKKQSKRFTPNENNVIKSYFFDRHWIRLLVFFASSFKANGHVRNFLFDNNLIDINEENNKDMSSVLSFSFGVNKKYIDEIKYELKIEEKGEFVENSKRRTKQFSLLEKIINHKINKDYDFNEISKTISKRNIKLLSNEIDTIFNTDINSVFTFLSHSILDASSNIDINSIELYFKNKFEFSQLSDGEFQLLSIFSLIDLFDTENTIFLLDEVDSHLHYKNIKELWNKLTSVKGKVLTTTHLIDSIMMNDFNSIKLIEDGKILQQTPIEKVFKRLDLITANDTYKFKIASKISNLVLVENYTDWFIFKELCKIKLDNYDENILNNIQYINCSSGYENHTVLFGNSKLNWYKKYKEVINKPESKTKNIFMICDKDELPIESIKDNLQVKQTEELKNILRKHSRPTPHLLSWKRKQIENYLISKTMLEKYNRTDIILDKLERSFELENTPMDCLQIQNLEIKDQIKVLYSDDINGIDYSKLLEVISEIPKKEISDDIKTMYEYIKPKVV